MKSESQDRLLETVSPYEHEIRQLGPRIPAAAEATA